MFTLLVPPIRCRHYTGGRHSAHEGPCTNDVQSMYWASGEAMPLPAFTGVVSLRQLRQRLGERFQVPALCVSIFSTRAEQGEGVGRCHHSQPLQDIVYHLR